MFNKNILYKYSFISILSFMFYLNCGYSQTALDEIHFVGDIDNSLPASVGLINSNDDAINIFDLTTQTAISSNDLGVLDQAGIDGFHKTGDGCGDSLYSLDTGAIISGVAMRSSDVFTAAGIKILDASSAGVPDGINIDAISRDPSTCDLVISVDSISLLGGVAYSADDLIRWNSASGFSLFQSTGFNANIDALHVLSTSRMLVSFDNSTSLPDIDTLDEDVYEVSPSGTGFQLLVVDLASQNTSWDGADLNALWAKPTPIIDFVFADGFE